MQRKLVAAFVLSSVLFACADDDSESNDGGRQGAEAESGTHFSFFVTSYAAIQRLSGSQSGFGGDLRYGEPDGLSGADKICGEIADGSLAGAGKKKWRAFLSATKGTDGKQVNAIDRIGEGPWYDRRGRLVAQAKADLLSDRPTSADTAIANDLPNEDGVPNHAPDGTQVDNHDTLTGTNDQGQLFAADWSSTCHDWTSAVGTDGRPRVGHSWPRDFAAFGGMGGFPFPTDGGMGGFPFPTDGGMGGFPFPGGGGASGGFDFGQIGSINGSSWISSLNEAGCAPGAMLIEMGPPNSNNPTVGSGGGYGGFYCFALQP